MILIAVPQVVRFFLNDLEFNPQLLDLVVQVLHTLLQLQYVLLLIVLLLFELAYV